MIPRFESEIIVVRKLGGVAQAATAVPKRPIVSGVRLTSQRGKTDEHEGWRGLSRRSRPLGVARSSP